MTFPQCSGDVEGGHTEAGDGRLSQVSQLTSADSREISVTNVINTFLSRPPLSILDEQILALQDAPEMSVRLIKFND